MAEELTQYTKEVAQGVKQAARDVAKSTKQKIVRRAPKRTKAYSKSWRVKEAYESENELRVVVHSKQYQLTHLLENPHQTVNGKTVAARPHIREAEREAIEEFEKKVEAVIGGSKP